MQQMKNSVNDLGKNVFKLSSMCVLLVKRVNNEDINCKKNEKCYNNNVYIVMYREFI
jgi:hypothetical protein